MNKLEKTYALARSLWAAHFAVRFGVAHRVALRQMGDGHMPMYWVKLAQMVELDMEKGATLLTPYEIPEERKAN